MIMVALLATSCMHATAQINGTNSTTQAIDLRQQTFNQRSIFSYSLDEITDLLGRPSGVKPERVGNKYYFGPELYYYDLGLRFDFPHSKKGPQKVEQIRIFLSKTLDENQSKYFIPFAGNLHPSLSSNWKTDRVVKEFPSLNFKVDNSAGSFAQNLEHLSAMSGIPIAGDPFLAYELLPTLTADSDKGRISFGFDKTTKFIEWISLSAPEEK